MTAVCIPRQIPKYGIPFFAGKLDRLDLPLDPAILRTRPEPAARRCSRRRKVRIACLELLRLDPLDEDPRRMGKPGVAQRFVDRLVGVAVLDVLPDDRNRHFLERVADPVEKLLPVIEVQLADRQTELVDDQPVQLVLRQTDSGTS